MVQPKKPPVSLRLPEATRVAVEQWATERGIPRNAAYVELLQRGLKLATGAGRPRDTTPRTAPPPAERGEPFRGVTASGEPLPVRKAQPKGTKK